MVNFLLGEDFTIMIFKNCRQCPHCTLYGRKESNSDLCEIGRIFEEDLSQTFLHQNMILLCFLLLNIYI